MTPSRLRQHLHSRPDTRILAELPPQDLALGLEPLAEESPFDLDIQSLLAEATRWEQLSRPREMPPEFSPLKVVRWDDWTATYRCRHHRSGRPYLVRVLQKHAGHPPNYRRLKREFRVLQRLYPDHLEWRDGAFPTIIHPLWDLPVNELTTMGSTQELRILASCISDLIRREELGLSGVEYDDEEMTTNGVAVSSVCLHIEERSPSIDALVHRVHSLLSSDIALRVVSGLGHVRVGTASELRDWMSKCLAEHAAQLRHEAHYRWRNRVHQRRMTRLTAALNRLSRVPPPIGRGKVGYDLDGHPTQLVGSIERLSWTSHQGPELVVWDEQGLHHATARRLLRARVHAVPTPTAPVSTFADLACRWVAAQLKTHRLATSNQSAP